MKLSTRAAACVAALCGTANAALFADSFASTPNDLMLTGIYDSSTGSTNFTVQTSKNGVNLGWIGIGTGTQMAGASMMVGWVNTDNSVVLSQRHATGEYMPTTQGLVLPKFAVQTSNTKSTSAGTTFNWIQPGFPASGADLAQTNMIFALNPGGSPDSMDPSAMLYKHSTRGFITLDLTKPYTEGSGAVSGTVSTSTTGSRTLNMRNNIIIAHMVIGIIAWFILLPLGIFLARFGRSNFTWFPKHRAVQSVAVVFVIVAMFLGFGANWTIGAPNLVDQHHMLGLALVCLVIFQAILGAAGHHIRKVSGVRVQNYLHMVIGVTLVPLAVWNAGKGLDLWEWAPPMAASIVVSGDGQAFALEKKLTRCQPSFFNSSTSGSVCSVSSTWPASCLCRSRSSTRGSTRRTARRARR